MKHDFNSDTSEPFTRCTVCGFHEIDHTDRATCETCGNSGNCDIIVAGMLQCEDCIAKDAELAVEMQGHIRGPLADRTKKEIEKNIDQTIRISQDIFNAKLAPIHELKLAIDADESIPEDKKHLTLAQTLETRYNHLSTVLFEIKEKSKEYSTEQVAIQQYYNELRKKLKAEEQALIKLKDINYNPTPPKVVKPRAPKISKPYTKQQLILAAAASKLPMERIATICISRNVTPMDAVAIINGSNDEIKRIVQESGIPEILIQSVVDKRGVSAEEAIKILKESGM